jgi:hypothetical protein
VNYRITEVSGWIIVSLSGKAANNEPLKVKHLFKRWLAEQGMRVIVNLKEIEEFGVWEMGLLTSFKKRDGSAGRDIAALQPRFVARGLFSKRPLRRTVRHLFQSRKRHGRKKEPRKWTIERT